MDREMRTGGSHLPENDVSQKNLALKSEVVKPKAVANTYVDENE